MAVVYGERGVKGKRGCPRDLGVESTWDIAGHFKEFKYCSYWHAEPLKTLDQKRGTLGVNVYKNCSSCCAENKL